MTTDPDYFYYRGNQLINVLQGQGQSQPGQRFFQTATGLSAQINVGGNAGTWLIGADALGSILGGGDGKNSEEHRYAPYGGEKQQGATESVMKLGYTGAYRDPVTSLYPLGSGYRCYLPELMCFNKADSLSPFGAGGINTRSYCEGDPINHSDPSGHAKKSWASHPGILMGIFGIVGAVFTGGALAIPMAVLGATAVVTGVTSVALPGKDEQAKDILGYISFGAGMASGLLDSVKRVAGEIAEKVIPPLQSGRLEGVLELGPSTDGIVEISNPVAAEAIEASSSSLGRGRRSFDLRGSKKNPETLEELSQELQERNVHRVIPTTVSTILAKYKDGYPIEEAVFSLDELANAVQTAYNRRDAMPAEVDEALLLGAGDNISDSERAITQIVYPSAQTQNLLTDVYNELVNKPVFLNLSADTANNALLLGGRPYLFTSILNRT